MSDGVLCVLRVFVLNLFKSLLMFYVFLELYCCQGPTRRGPRRVQGCPAPLQPTLRLLALLPALHSSSLPDNDSTQPSEAMLLPILLHLANIMPSCDITGRGQLGAESGEPGSGQVHSVLLLGIATGLSHPVVLRAPEGTYGLSGVGYGVGCSQGHAT